MLKVVNQLRLASFPAALLANSKITAATPAAVFALMSEMKKNVAYDTDIVSGDIVVMTDGREAVVIATDEETKEIVGHWLDCCLDCP